MLSLTCIENLGEFMAYLLDPSYLLDREIDLEGGALVEEVYLVLLFESCGYREYFYRMISYSLIFYFSSTIALYFGQSN